MNDLQQAMSKQLHTCRQIIDVSFLSHIQFLMENFKKALQYLDKWYLTIFYFQNFRIHITKFNQIPTIVIIMLEYYLYRGTHEVWLRETRRSIHEDDANATFLHSSNPEQIHSTLNLKANQQLYDKMVWFSIDLSRILYYLLKWKLNWSAGL